MGVYFNYLEYMHIYNTYIFITKHIQILYIYICNTILHHVGEGNGNPLWYSCLENPIERGAWQATVHGVAKVGLSN